MQYKYTYIRIVDKKNNEKKGEILKKRRNMDKNV